MEAGIMLEFPLCCLSYLDQDRNKIDRIISYCIVEHSKKIESKISERVNLLLAADDPPGGFIKTSAAHKKILLAYYELGMRSGYIPDTIQRYQDLYFHVNNHKLKYGSNSYCRVGKSICFDARDGKFPLRLFLVHCAIQSILGKKAKFKRITKDRIRFAMLGYKSRDVALKEMNPKEKLLTDRQLGVAIDTLHAKGFFSKFTYANRQTFYSTRFKENNKHSDILLIDAVKSSKVFWAKKKANLLDKAGTNEIKEEIKKLKLIKFNNQVRSA